MNALKAACAAGALLFASLSAVCAAPAGIDRNVGGPASGGGWIYDGRQPPSCDIRDIRVRHFAGDGHSSDSADHAHLGHGHKWSKRDFKGYATKPPCYVRRASAERPTSAPSLSAGISVAFRNVLSGDLS